MDERNHSTICIFWRSARNVKGVSLIVTKSILIVSNINRPVKQKLSMNRYNFCTWHGPLFISCTCIRTNCPWLCREQHWREHNNIPTVYWSATFRISLLTSVVGPPSGQHDLHPKTPESADCVWGTSQKWRFEPAAPWCRAGVTEKSNLLIWGDGREEVV